MLWFIVLSLREFDNWEEILASEDSAFVPGGRSERIGGFIALCFCRRRIVNSQGLPTLDQAVLTRLLSLIADGLVLQCCLHLWTIVVSNAQVLQLYRDRTCKYGDYLGVEFSSGPDEKMIPLIPVWMKHRIHLQQPGCGRWRVPTLKIKHWRLNWQNILIAEEFLGEWTRATGYLPTRPLEC